MSELEGRPELVKKRARSITVRNILIGIVLTYMFVTTGTICLLAVNTYQDRQTGKQTSAVLLDCTVPEGKCYQRGQEGQAAAIKLLIEAGQARAVKTRAIVIATAYCKDLPGNDTIPELEDCVYKELKK